VLLLKKKRRRKNVIRANETAAKMKLRFPLIFVELVGLDI